MRCCNVGYTFLAAAVALQHEFSMSTLRRIIWLIATTAALTLVSALTGCDHHSGPTGGGQAGGAAAASAAAQSGPAVAAPATAASDSPAGASQ
jgi:hypothetical protein